MLSFAIQSQALSHDCLIKYSTFANNNGGLWNKEWKFIIREYPLIWRWGGAKNMNVLLDQLYR